MELAEEQGIEQGIEKGIEQGIKTGRQQKKEIIALELKQRGIDVATIANCTKLSIEKIEAL